MLNYFKGSLSDEKITMMKQVEAVIRDQTSKDLFNRQYASKQLLYKIYVEGEIVKDSYEGFFNQLFGQKKIDLKEPIKVLGTFEVNVKVLLLLSSQTSLMVLYTKYQISPDFSTKY